MNLELLKNELPYKIKIQAKPKPEEKLSNGKVVPEKKGVCVAYIDARDCMDILDKVCGVGNRQNEFYEVKGKVFCKVGIFVNGSRVWKSDSGALGDDENVEEETTSKGETSDAFKRACVQRGIGRFLYSLPKMWINLNDFEKNKYNLTDFFLKGKKPQAPVKKEPEKEEPEQKSDKKLLTKERIQKQEFKDRYKKNGLEVLKEKFQVSQEIEDIITSPDFDTSALPDFLN